MTVTVPMVEILSSSIDPASIETYDQSFSIVNQMRSVKVTSFLADRELLRKTRLRAYDKAQSRLKGGSEEQVNASLSERASALRGSRVTLQRNGVTDQSHGA